jgi:hypothetical protein
VKAGKAGTQQEFSFGGRILYTGSGSVLFKKEGDASSNLPRGRRKL